MVITMVSHGQLNRGCPWVIVGTHGREHGSPEVPTGPHGDNTKSLMYETGQQSHRPVL